MGVTLVGWASIAYSDHAKKENSGDGKSSKAGGTTLLGIMLLLLSQCFTGSQFIIEEKLFDGY